MRAQLDAGAQRGGPIGDVGRRLRALRAGGRAMAEIDAAGAALVVGGRHRGVRRPPVPAELVHGLADDRTGAAERLRRHRRLGQWRERVPGQPGYPHHAVVLGKERRQRVVVDRPVVGDAVERFHAKIGRMQPRPVRGVHHGRAADAVEIHHLDRRIVVVDRIVLGPGADVRARRIIAIEARLPVPARARILRRIHPAALVEAEDVHFCVGETPGDRGAGSAGADDQDVNGIVHFGSFGHSGARVSATRNLTAPDSMLRIAPE